MKNIHTMPIFESEADYCLRRGELDFWWPYIESVLVQHQLRGSDKHEIAIRGTNPTYPVFLIDDIVIKFFGHRPNWFNAFSIECMAHDCLIKDSTILAPRILAKGALFPNEKRPWPYIISTKIAGQAWVESTLTFDEKNTIAAEIGRQLRKIHALPVDKDLRHDHEWAKLNVKAAAEESILPKHLVTQVSDFIAKLSDFDRCFVNGDMVDTHVFVNQGQLSGIIDWGDATVTDRHYELGKLMDSFDWDKRLLKTVLETSNWPMKKNFTTQALGLALYRQAVGLTQHSTFDVFYKLPNLISLQDIGSLDELAEVLFGV